MARKNIIIGITDFDWVTLSMYLGLVMTGWMMVYSVGYDGDTHPFELGTRHGSQFIWIIISVFVGLVVVLLDSKFYQTFAFAIYGLMVLAQLTVLVFGTEVNGANAWIDLGFFRFQPSEFAKFATCLALAGHLGGFNTTLRSPRTRLIAVAIIVVPLLVAILQRDVGSGLVFMSLFIVLFREGMPPFLYIVGIVIAVLSIFALMVDSTAILLLGLALVASGLVINTYKSNGLRVGFLTFGAATIAIFHYFPKSHWYMVLVAALVFGVLFTLKVLAKKRQFAYIVGVSLLASSAYIFSVNYTFYKIFEPHQQERVLVWLRPEKFDPLGALYNITWSKRAIGSGGFWGKGFLKGNITKLNYVPEQVTDFIFCAVGEEQGFVGATAVIILFTMLLLRIITIAERNRSKFVRVYGYGVASVLFFHLLVNVGMTMGLAPVIGIPLPFISYGGSSLLGFTILLAILLKLDSNRIGAY